MEHSKVDVRQFGNTRLFMERLEIFISRKATGFVRDVD